MGGILPVPYSAPMPSPTTFPALLADRLRRDAARPLVTFYDDATGERVELSVTTYANWVAKTAGLVQDELDIERGALLLVDLPTHWLGAVWLGAAWTLGLRVTDDRASVDEADLVVCGPDSVDAVTPAADRVPVVALSLRPLGARFDVPLPPGVVDYGAVVLGQPDAFVPLDRAAGHDVAWSGKGGELTQADVLRSTVAGLEEGGRLLTDANPCSYDGLATLVAPLAAGGGTVWVRHPDEDGWTRRYDAERASVELRA
jgi:uncharacterized protein (TIGR03089 family)